MLEQYGKTCSFQWVTGRSQESTCAWLNPRLPCPRILPLHSPSQRTLVTYPPRPTLAHCLGYSKQGWQRHNCNISVSFETVSYTDDQITNPVAGLRAPNLQAGWRRTRSWAHRPLKLFWMTARMCLLTRSSKYWMVLLQHFLPFLWIYIKSFSVSTSVKTETYLRGKSVPFQEWVKFIHK